MRLSRREFVSGCMVAAAGVSIGSPVRSSIGGKMIFGGNEGSDQEEEMYKEMYKALVCNVPAGETVKFYDPDVTYIGPHFLCYRNWNRNGSPYTGSIEIDFPNCTQIGVGSLGDCFHGCNLVYVNLPKLEKTNGQYNFADNKCTEILLPSLTNFNNHDFSYSSTLKVLRLPSVTSRSGSFFVYQDTALEHVYLPKMTLAQIGGASYIAQQNCNPAAIFHLQDGDYDYRGNPI